MIANYLDSRADADSLRSEEYIDYVSRLAQYVMELLVYPAAPKGLQHSRGFFRGEFVCPLTPLI